MRRLLGLNFSFISFIILLNTVMISLFFLLSLTSSAFGLPDGFIYTGHLNVTNPILVSLRYGTNANFVGAVVRGYENVPSHGAVVTVDAGEALVQAQEEFFKDGFRIVIYVSFIQSTIRFCKMYIRFYWSLRIFSLKGLVSSVQSGRSFHGMGRKSRRR